MRLDFSNLYLSAFIPTFHTFRITNVPSSQRTTFTAVPGHHWDIGYCLEKPAAVSFREVGDYRLNAKLLSSCELFSFLWFALYRLISGHLHVGYYSIIRRLYLLLVQICSKVSPYSKSTKSFRFAHFGQLRRFLHASPAYHSRFTFHWRWCKQGCDRADRDSRRHHAELSILATGRKTLRTTRKYEESFTDLSRVF